MNEQLKPYKTVEQIAKKHRMDVSDIQKQLNMGAPIEHEHTKNQKLAVEIALQHLDEFPDYYTRLKKMEASAKKEHKKFKDVKEDAVTDLQRGIVELDDASYANIDKVMRGIMKKRKVTAKQLHDDFVDKNNQTPDTWAKKNMKEEKKKTLRNTNPCWKGYTDIGTKMKKGKKVPNCVPVKEATEMKRYCPKCAKDETRDECKYGQKYWDMFSMPIMLKDYTPNTPHPGNMPEEKDHEYSMARSELSTIVTAAKRLRKKIGKGEGNLKSWVQSKITKAADYIDTAADYIDSGEMKKESVSIEDANGNHYAQFIDIIKTQPLKASKGIGSRLVGESISSEPKLKPGFGIGGGKPVYMKGKEPRPTGAELPKLPLAKGEGGSPYEPYKAPKEDPKNPYVPAPKRPKVQLAHYESEGKTLSEFMIEASPAWQRKEGKNPEGGLNAKGVASYRAQNRGSKLQTAVTTEPSKLKPGSKDAKRRKSFCARMGGMPGPMKDEKGRPTRKALSLRKWNC